MKSKELLLWGKFAKKNKNNPHIDRLLGKYKSKEFISLVRKWLNDLEGKRILKTDLREEAFGEDEVLFSLSTGNTQFFALDISEEITRKADIQQKKRDLKHRYITADIREIPFGENAFDIVFSTSTLDHFSSEKDFVKALSELKRVVRPGGHLIITINNKCSINFYLLEKLQKLLNLTSYPVQLYSLGELKSIFKKVGLSICDSDFNVHIIGPVNSLLLLLRKFMDDNFIDKIAHGFIVFSYWLDKRKRTRILTGWFIALKCAKDLES